VTGLSSPRPDISLGADLVSTSGMQVQF